MSDSIVNCIIHNHDLNGNPILLYEVTFAFDGFTAHQTDNPVFVFSVELTNPEDLEEVKTVACRKAAVTKAFYVNGTSTDAINGPVTL